MVIETKQAFADALAILAAHPDWVVDIESNGFDAFGMNQLCGIGIMPLGDPDHAYYFPFRHHQGENLGMEELYQLLEVMSTRRMIVGHNIKFDLHFLVKDGLKVNGIRFLVDTAMMVRITSATWVRRVGLEETIRVDYGEEAASYDKIAKAELKRLKFMKDFSLAHPYLLGLYCIKDIQWTDQIFTDRMALIKKSDQLNIFERQVRLTPTLYRMEARGVPVDAAWASRTAMALDARIEMLEQRAYKIAGKEFNIKSTTQKTEVFNKLGIHSHVRTEKKKEESWSEEALIAINHPLAGILRQAQALRTLKSTFIEPYITMETLHCSFIQYGTMTGRLSSANPNAQNIPRDCYMLFDRRLSPEELVVVKKLVDAIITTKGYDIDTPVFDDDVWDLWSYLTEQKYDDSNPDIIHARRAFVRRKGYRMIGLDYSQMEVRVFLSYLGTPEAEALLRSAATDFHGESAKVAFNVTEDDPNWAFFRQAAKTLVFGITYGQGLLKIATQLGFLRKYREELKEAGGAMVKLAAPEKGPASYKTVWIDIDKMTKPQIQRATVDEAKKEAKKYRDEYFANMKGSKQFLQQVIETVKNRGWIRNRFGRIYRIEKDFGYKGVNYLVQGTSADIMNERIVEVDKYLADKKSNILLQVHDELILEVHESEINEVPYEVKKIMEVNSLDIPLRVEVEEFPHSWAYKEDRVAIEGALLNCTQKEYDELEAA